MEIRSKNDSQAYLDRKVADYLAAGVKLVWVAHPDAKTVTAHRAGTPPQSFAASQTLPLEFVPGFELPVEEIFRE